MIKRIAQRVLCFRPLYGVNHIFNTYTATPIAEALQAKNQKSMDRNLPFQSEEEMLYLEENEIDARIIKIIRSYEKFDLQKINWLGHFQKDIGLDSLERVALLTSIEHEFTVIFEDRLFDNLNSLQDIRQQLLKDDSAF